MYKFFIIFTLLTITLAYRQPTSPAYYGFSSSYVPKAKPYSLISHASYPGPSYAIPQPSYSYAKSSYSEPEEKPNPYSFGYKINDEYGNANFQNEEGDDYGSKKGSYGYTDAYGIYRKVDYIADGYGFRATVSTNEPGTAPQSPASVKWNSKPLDNNVAYAASYPPASYVAPISAYKMPSSAYYSSPYGYSKHY